MVNGKPLVSLIVPVKDDARRLERCLASVTANAYPSEEFEVIVADNGSTDDSVGVATRSGARVLPLPGLRVSGVRNRAAAQAQGDVLAFIDADHEIARDWLASAVDALADGRVGAVGALYVAPPDGTWVQRAYGALRGRTSGQQDVEWLGSGNMAVRRDAFHAVDGFDASLESCEDVDLCQRLRGAGWRVIGDARLESIHYGDPATLGALFRAERWRGRDNVRASLRGPLSLRNLPSVLIPVFDATAIVVAVALLVGVGFVGARAWLGIAAALTVVLGFATLRAAWMIPRLRAQGLGARVFQAFVVCLTYDLARAAALLTRASHHRRQPETPAASSVSPA